jgi:hypothetical protein
VAEHKIISLRSVSAASRADSLSGVTVEEHTRTPVAISPVVLLIGAGGPVMGKFEIISLCVMTTTGRTSPFAGKSVEKHDVTFIAISPVSLNRRVGRWWGIG